jgi:hypothetical protein
MEESQFYENSFSIEIVTPLDQISINRKKFFDICASLAVLIIEKRKLEKEIKERTHEIQIQNQNNSSDHALIEFHYIQKQFAEGELNICNKKINAIEHLLI